MVSIDQISENYEQNLRQFSAIIEEMRAKLKKVDHKIKGKQIQKKWTSVFVMFGAWVILMNRFPQQAKDFLIVFTVLGSSYGIVHLIFKPYIDKEKLKLYTQTKNELSPRFESLIGSLVSLLSDDNSSDDTIKIVNFAKSQVAEDSTDFSVEGNVKYLNSDMYAEIVREILDKEVRESDVLAKLCMSKFIDIPFHELDL